ncbi:MAG: hypothetical protein ACK5PP_11315, partial [Acidimicrobiales bacterium]
MTTSALHVTGTVTRLALGVEPRDGVGGHRVRSGIRLLVETDRIRDRRHASNRFALTVADVIALGSPATVRLLLVDPRRHHVPRRFRVTLPDVAALLDQENDPGSTDAPASGRIIRPRLAPGAAYPVAARATGFVARIRSAGSPLRWSRVRVTDPADGAELAVGPGDDRG